jgi:hypothetical protein
MVTTKYSWRKPFIIIFPFSRFNKDRNEDLGMDLSQEKSN